MTKIEVKVIFLKEEKDVNVFEEELLDEFEHYLEEASERRTVDFNYYCALKKLLKEKEIEIKLKYKKEKYIYNLDKEHEERLKNERKNI